MSTALVLLAAGLSRRMGQDKLLMQRHGKPLYRYALELMECFPDCSRLVVSNIEEIADAAQALGFQTIGNPLAAQGMGSADMERVADGIAAMVEDAEANRPAVLEMVRELTAKYPLYRNL